MLKTKIWWNRVRLCWGATWRGIAWCR